jgi:YidC/Oxa1 family membrane protein insertase
LKVEFVREENRNLILAIVLSLLVFLGWDYFVTRPQALKQKAVAEAQAKLRKPSATATTADVGATPVASAASAVQSREAAIGLGRRINIKSTTLQGSINLKGARLDDLVMVKHRETIKKDSSAVVLLSPSGTQHPYFLEAGWLGQNMRLPDSNSIWTADKAELTPTKPVTLSWNNGAGLIFTQKIALDEQYLFTVTQSVINRSAAPVTLAAYGLISRTKPAKLEGGYTVHEGAIGAFGKLVEVDYDEVGVSGPEDVPVEDMRGGRGWFGFTDKYWLTALIGTDGTAMEANVRNPDAAAVRYQAELKFAPQTIAPGKVGATDLRLFAGAKEVAVINAYQSSLKLFKFDYAIDWGWYPFLTKPFFSVLHWLYTLFNNFGVAIICLTLIVKAIMFPLAYKGYKSMARMKLVQPKIKELQARYKDDKAAMQKAQIELFAKEKINPIGGCLPLLPQIPVFYALYKVLFISLEMRHQPFALWIKDLSAPDPLTPVNLFGLLPFTPPIFLAIGVLPILYAITFHFQMKLQPQTGLDPAQQQVFKFMPWIFMFMFASFSAGLVLYWTVSNILSIIQQWALMKMDEKSETNVKPAAT